MRSTRQFTSAGALIAVLFLAGCGSTDLGGILGGGSSGAVSEVRGTVDRVDVSGRYIVLTNIDSTTSSLNNGGGRSATVYFDDRTTVEYQGQGYRPEDLERGDRIAAQVDDGSNRLYTDRIVVLSDVSSGTSAGGDYGTNLSGTVSNVDTRNRILEIDRATYGSRSDIVRVEYNTSTTVRYEGRSYRLEDLDRGDVVDLRVSNLGGGRYLAEEIQVVRSIADAGSGSGSYGQNVVRGAVRYVDTRNRSIELERAAWSSGFAPGNGSSTGSGVVVIHYSANTPVEYRGNNYTPENLERGDVIDVRVQNASSSTLMADRIVVVSDSRAF
jgi:hypothetical protein